MKTKEKEKQMEDLFEELSDSAKAMANFATASAEAYFERAEHEDDEPDADKEGSSILKDISDFLERNNIKSTYRSKLIGLFLIFLTYYVSRSAVEQLIAIYYVDYTRLSYSLLSAVMVLIPFGVFVLSTMYSYWNFHKQKIIFFMMCLLNFALLLTRIAFRFIVSIAVPFCLKIQINEAVTKDMVVFLMRFATGIPTLAFFIYIMYKLSRTFLDPEIKKGILGYRLYIDTRNRKKFLYDLKVIRYMEDGRTYRIMEDDRSLHMLINGSTGTGKTSMTMMPLIAKDLDKKVLNEDMQKRELVREIKKGNIYISEPFNDYNFNIKYFKAKKGFEHVLEKIKNNYRSCGLTLVAPDEETTDEAYELCVAKGIPCNRVDPIKVSGKNYMKPGAIGFNPMYISSHVPEWDRNREIIKKATLFADVLQFINDLKGKTDPYFTGVNRSTTTAFTILLEKTYPILHGGKQPNPGVLQSLINNFSRVKPYYDAFIKLPDVGEFEFVRDFIEYDILGAGAANMNKHVSGLRIIMNEFLTNPLVRSIVCAEKSIDMDEMLAEGQVTVVNYALQLGATDSIALGLFFVLSFNDAVIRRPGNRKTRLPHYYLIDELPLLLHPQIERCFSLFRKYRVGMCCAIQTLDQMNRTETTRYLKGVILGCGHHILFGRVGTTEMKLYSELAGVEYSLMTQDTISQTSITTENPSYSYSSRTTPKDVNVQEGSDLRNRPFKEVTVYSLENGSLVKPFHGKVDFLTPKDRRKIKRYRVDWASLYDKNSIPIKEPEEKVLEGEYFATSEVNVPMKKDAGIIWDLVSNQDENNSKAGNISDSDSNHEIPVQVSDINVDEEEDIFKVEEEDDELIDSGVMLD